MDSIMEQNIAHRIRKWEHLPEYQKERYGHDIFKYIRQKYDRIPEPELDALVMKIGATLAPEVQLAFEKAMASLKDIAVRMQPTMGELKEAIEMAAERIKQAQEEDEFYFE